jgi:hypothetical protein
VKLWSAVSGAVLGWRAILRGDDTWRSHFRLTGAGFATALVIFLFVAFLIVAMASASFGMPHFIGVLAAMLVLAIPLIALELSLLATRALLRSDQPLLPILVPGLYAATAFLLIEGLLAMIGGPIVMLSWAAFGYLVYRLARAATGWNLGVSAGFAVLTVLLLVALRVSLYMLTNPPGSPI